MASIMQIPTASVEMLDFVPDLVNTDEGEGISSIEPNFLLESVFTNYGRPYSLTSGEIDSFASNLCT